MSTWQQIAKAACWMGVIASGLCCFIGYAGGSKTPEGVGNTLGVSILVGVIVCIMSVPFVAFIIVIGKGIASLSKSSATPLDSHVAKKHDDTEARAAQTAKWEQDRRRRMEARAHCEVLFVKHSFELRQRFTREIFDSFMGKHLSDDHPVEYVERRSKELQDIIHEHLKKATPQHAIPDSQEREAARAAVQSCYDDHAHLLTESFPPIRFLAEMKARIPESVSADAAWKQARKMIQDLLTIITAEKEKREQAAARSRQQAAVKPQPTRTVNPDDLDFS